MRFSDQSQIQNKIKMSSDGIRAISPTSSHIRQRNEIASASSSIELPPSPQPQAPTITKKPKRRPLIEATVNAPADNTLGNLANVSRVRTQRFEAELSEARESISEASSSMPLPDISSSGGIDDISDDVPMPPSRRRRPKMKVKSKRAPPSFSIDEEDDDNDGDSDLGMPEPQSRIEVEIEKGIRKAKLLARMEQLVTRGIPMSKKFTYRASEEELMVEVAKMEAIFYRTQRIKKGRGWFLSATTGIEKTCGFIDRKEWGPFGFKFCMDDFTKETIKDIQLYDDCLERGVESVFGPGGHEGPWYVELASILIPAMVNHSIMNRFKDDPNHTNEVLNSNDKLRAEVADRIAAEQMRANAAASARASAAGGAAGAGVATVSAAGNNTIGTSRQGLRLRPPPPQPDPAETAKMQANIEQMRLFESQRREIADQNARIQQLMTQMENQARQLQLAQATAANAQASARTANAQATGANAQVGQAAAQAAQANAQAAAQAAQRAKANAAIRDGVDEYEHEDESSNAIPSAMSSSGDDDQIVVE